MVLKHLCHKTWGKFIELISFEEEEDLLQECSASYDRKQIHIDIFPIQNVGFLVMLLIGLIIEMVLNGFIQNKIQTYDVNYNLKLYLFNTFYAGIPLLIVIAVKSRLDIHLAHGSFLAGLRGGFPLFFFSALTIPCATYLCIVKDQMPYFIGKFTIVFIAAGAEELWFRGILQNAMKRVFDSNQILCDFWVVTISALFFGLAHFTRMQLSSISIANLKWAFIVVLPTVIHACGFGFFLGAIYTRYENLWVTIFIHTCYNLSIPCRHICMHFQDVYALPLKVYSIMTNLLIPIYLVFGIYHIWRKYTINREERNTVDETIEINTNSHPAE